MLLRGATDPLARNPRSVCWGPAIRLQGTRNLPTGDPQSACSGSVVRLWGFEVAYVGICCLGVGNRGAWGECGSFGSVMAARGASVCHAQADPSAGWSATRRPGSPMRRAGHRRGTSCALESRGGGRAPHLGALGRAQAAAEHGEPLCDVKERGPPPKQKKYPERRGDPPWHAHSRRPGRRKLGLRLTGAIRFSRNAGTADVQSRARGCRSAGTRRSRE